MKEEIKSSIIDTDKLFESMKEQQNLSQKKYELEMKEESERISNLCCPLCKSLDKYLHIDYSTSGIYGPGGSSKIHNEYYICNECGILFRDLKKKDIRRPTNLFNF